MYYLTLFFVFSIFGFIFENILIFICGLDFSSGVLYGPWTPIYGVAILAILGINHFLKRMRLEKTLEIVLFYIISTFVMSLIEFAGGSIISEYMHINNFWDYREYRYNIGKYVTLEIAVMWGAFATFVNYVVYSRVEKYLKKIPKFITILIFIAFIADFLYTKIIG